MEQYIPSIIILFILSLLLASLLSTVAADPYIQREKRKIFLLIILLLVSLVIQNYAGYLLDRRSALPRVRTVVEICGYCVRPIILILYCYIVNMERIHRKMWILIGINTLVHLTALFSDICFTINENNDFVRGPLGFTCHVVSGILLVYLLWLTASMRRPDRGRTIWLPIANALVIAASVSADSLVDYSDCPVSFLTASAVAGSVFYYIWLHLQFVREHEEDLKAQQRIQIMMSQIQPHFLYNTITTIEALCKQDPDRAAEVTENFGIFLRKNLESLSEDGRIPFEKELEHTRAYADIQKVRFGTIRVEYDIRDKDFSLPPLTIQPLVENAIRHGIRIREEGIVWVKTRRLEDCHEIRVEDNGTGFDVKAIEKADKSHVGIRNVRGRIEKICGGSLKIESRAGEGTTVIIRIPVEEEETGS